MATATGVQATVALKTEQMNANKPVCKATCKYFDAYGSNWKVQCNICERCSRYGRPRKDFYELIEKVDNSDQIGQLNTNELVS